MVALERNFVPFIEISRSNLEVGLDGKSGDTKNQKKELKKMLEKDTSSLISNSYSPYIFNVEGKVDIKHYKGETDVIKLNQLLQQLEFF